jgi:tetraacyldisaccharide 4'-kinase
VDFIVANGGASGCTSREWVMDVLPRAFVNVRTGQRVPALDFAATRVHALAGIGNPERFFATLRRLGLNPQACPFDDHHRFVAKDLRFDDDAPIVITEKDAVKIHHMEPDEIPPQCWYLEIDVTLSEAAQVALAECLARRGIVAQRSQLAEAR